MGNKDYRLPGLPVVPSIWTTVKRSTTITRAVPLGMRYAILDAAHGRCARCGHGLSDGIRLHVDHRVPFSLGGRTEKRNLQALCDKCNLGKGNRFLR
jgi:5-methylcytosine-specific restriction endonuclease McrA